MAEPTSMLMLVNDLAKSAEKLHGATESKQWKEAHQQARVVLGLASRTFSRLDGIVAALAELEAEA